jgi:hypothetical protein
MEFPFIEKLEDANEQQLLDLIKLFEKEDLMESQKVLVLEKFNKHNQEYHKAIDELKKTPNDRRFRQLRLSYIHQVIEFLKEYKKIC